MPVLSPTIWIVLVAATLQCLTGLGWWMTSHKLDKTAEQLSDCRAEHKAFVRQTELTGKHAAEEARQIDAENERIRNETAKGWAAALDVVRADATRRLRIERAARDSGSRQMPGASGGSVRIDDAAESPLPPPETVTADCSEDVLKLVWLQHLYQQSSKLRLERTPND